MNQPTARARCFCFLTDWRAKPVLPFGRKFRIIDFTLPKCVNSGVLRIGVVTQYKSQRLIRHQYLAWSFADLTTMAHPSNIKNHIKAPRTTMNQQKSLPLVFDIWSRKTGRPFKPWVRLAKRAVASNAANTRHAARSASGGI
jgi:Nucleotidyl transferase